MTSIEDAARQAECAHDYDAYESERPPPNVGLWLFVGLLMWAAIIKAGLFLWEYAV